MKNQPDHIMLVLEGALLTAARPLNLKQLGRLFERRARPNDKTLLAALDDLERRCKGRACELRKVGSGYRLQVRKDYADWMARLFEERPPRYTRALMETLAVITYRQPVTRGDIEKVRGVGVSPSILQTLLEREWVKVVGHKPVPGSPALYGTTRQFLDYFNLSSLDELPPLPEVREMSAPPELDDLDLGRPPAADGDEAPGEGGASQESPESAEETTH